MFEAVKTSGGKISRLAIHEVSFKKALAAGVKIAFGPDAGPFPHRTQAIEFEWMTRYGMTPLQAIQAATINAADLMGWAGQIGAIEPGKFADMIAVDERYQPIGARAVRNEGRRCRSQRLRQVGLSNCQQALGPIFPVRGPKQRPRVRLSLRKAA